MDFCKQEYALFEPGCRHVAKDIMGQDRANPAAMILSATMMLRHLGSVTVFHSVVSLTLICLDYSLDHIANKIASATFQVLNAGRIKTADMGGKSWCPQRVTLFHSINSLAQVRQPLLSLRLR
jgi:isocitrate dehydrogenase (NAD+)